MSRRQQAIEAGARAIFRTITSHDAGDGSELDAAVWQDSIHFAASVIDATVKAGYLEWKRVDATAFPDPIRAGVSVQQAPSE